MATRPSPEPLPRETKKALCTSFPTSPNFSLQTTAKHFHAYIDARDGPNTPLPAAFTVSTVGNSSTSSKLQKEHAFGHRRQALCALSVTSMAFCAQIFALFA